MRLTLRTNLAMRVLMCAAVNPGRLVRKADIAEACNASTNHLGVVINQLAQAGYLTTVRGRTGGLRLARPPGEIRVGAVVRELEGNLGGTECFASADGSCPLTLCCRLRGILSKALEAFLRELDQVTLAELVDDNTALEALLNLEPA
ncbi:MAG: Rrf2 family transcriptional regulator [Pseudomonadota bacterium]